MKLSFAILAVLIIIVGIYPAFFIHLIQTVRFERKVHTDG